MLNQEIVILFYMRNGFGRIYKMADKNNSKVSFVKEGYLSLWFCITESEEILFQYVEKDYNEDSEEIKFQLGRDFNISWYDEDFFEASFEENLRGWDLLEGHSYVESILSTLKEEYKDAINGDYNSVIIFYNFKYDGNVKETINEKYGYFKFVGAFKYQC